MSVYVYICVRVYVCICFLGEGSGHALLPTLQCYRGEFLLSPLFSGDQQEGVPFVVGSEQT